VVTANANSKAIQDDKTQLGNKAVYDRPVRVKGGGLGTCLNPVSELAS
jgi:hypothetical protein